jgi:hypothetical protein
MFLQIIQEFLLDVKELVFLLHIWDDGGHFLLLFQVFFSKFGFLLEIFDPTRCDSNLSQFDSVTQYSDGKNN